MTRGIYRIGSVSSTFYVGQSIDVERRLRQHLYDLQSGRHSNEPLQRAFDRSPDEFSHFELVEEIPEGGMFLREADWIVDLGATCNLLIPGNDGWVITEEGREKRRGRVQSEEWVAKRIANAAKTRSREGYERKPAWNKGKTAEEDPRIRCIPLSPERRQALLELRLGKETPEETRRKISQSVRKTMEERTPEEREAHRGCIREGMKASGASEKISKARQGKSSWNQGIPRTDEVKQKLSEDWAKRPWLECPYCGKSYRLLNSHITKKHSGEK